MNAEEVSYNCFYMKSNSVSQYSRLSLVIFSFHFDEALERATVDQNATYLGDGFTTVNCLKISVLS